MFSQSIYGGNSRKKLFDISGLKNNAKKKTFYTKTFERVSTVWSYFFSLKWLGTCGQQSLKPGLLIGSWVTRFI